MDSPATPIQYASPRHRLRANILRVGLRLQAQLNALLGPYGLTQQQFNALRILRGQARLGHADNFSTQDLRERLLDRSADASRLVDRLAEKGLLTREPAAADKRRVDIRLSEKGVELLAEIDRISIQLDGLLHPLTDEEANEISTLLERVPL